MIVTVKEYNKDTETLLCTIESEAEKEDLQKVITVAPYAFGSDEPAYREISEKMIGEYYRIGSFAIYGDVYYASVLLHIPEAVSSKNITLSDFLEYTSRDRGAFPRNLIISHGQELTHKSGRKGIIVAWLSSRNLIKIYIGDGFSWEGTGQEFKEQWD